MRPAGQKIISFSLYFLLFCASTFCSSNKVNRTNVLYNFGPPSRNGLGELNGLPCRPSESERTSIRTNSRAERHLRHLKSEPTESESRRRPSGIPMATN